MTCPFLVYRDLSEVDAPAERAYCTAAGQFVQPLRADLCNDRYDLAHDEHCEIYLAHLEEDETAIDATEGGNTDG
jgi:hypothetical protein